MHSANSDAEVACGLQNRPVLSTALTPPGVFESVRKKGRSKHRPRCIELAPRSPVDNTRISVCRAVVCDTWCVRKGARALTDTCASQTVATLGPEELLKMSSRPSASDTASLSKFMCARGRWTCMQPGPAWQLGSHICHPQCCSESLQSTRAHA